MATQTAFFIFGIYGHQDWRNSHNTVCCEYFVDDFWLNNAKSNLTLAFFSSQLFNKVAGVYGLIAIFTGGTLAQVSMYIYSILALVLFVWGLRAVAAVSSGLISLSVHSNFITGKSEGRVLFRSCFRMRSSPIDTLVSLLCSELVGIHHT